MKTLQEQKTEIENIISEVKSRKDNLSENKIKLGLLEVKLNQILNEIESMNFIKESFLNGTAEYEFIVD